MSDAIVIPIGNGNTKSFTTIEEFEEWYKAELGFWIKLKRDAQGHPETFWNQVDQGGFFRIQKEIDRYKQTDPGREKVGALTTISAHCNDLFESGKMFLSTSPNGQFVSAVKHTRNGRAAAYAAAYLVGLIELYLDNSSDVLGFMEGFCFQAGLKERGPSESAAFEAMRADWERKFQAVKDEHKAEMVRFQEQIARSNEAVDALKEQIKEFLKDSQERWKANLSVIEEKLALSAPVTYWRQKAFWHLLGSIGFALASLGAGIAAVRELSALAKGVLTPPLGTADPEKWHPAYWQTATLLIGAAFAVWVVRILVKLLLSQIHLRSDAAERVTMVSTYLALLEAKKATDEDRGLIMAALFRPAATGVVKDDGMPPSVVEWLTRASKPG